MENCLISSNGNSKLHSYHGNGNFQTVSAWIFKFHQWKLFQILTMENQISTANMEIWISTLFKLVFWSPSWKLFWILMMENENSTEFPYYFNVGFGISNIDIMSNSNFKKSNFHYCYRKSNFQQDLYPAGHWNCFSRDFIDPFQLGLASYFPFKLWLLKLP